MTDRKKYEDFIIIALGVAMSYFIYVVVMSELPRGFADYNGHLYTYLPVFTGESWLMGWRTVPYCMWHMGVLALNLLLHIPLEASAAYVSCFFQVFTYLVIYWMIRKYTKAQGVAMDRAGAAVIAAGLSIAQPLYFYWLDAGTFSMNPLHNPTQMAVRPFILLNFALVIDIWGAQKDKEYRGIFFQVERGLKRYYLYLTALLLLSSMAKPVFAMMFIPAVGLLMLWEWFSRIIRKDGSAASYFKQCMVMLLCAAPTILYGLMSAASYYIFGGEIYQGENSLILTKWMEVWHIFSENVLLSIALNMAFPLFMILIDGSFYRKESMAKLALTGYLVSLLIAAFLSEEREKMGNADYMWPMLCGMLLLWMTALLRLVVLEKTQTDTKTKRILVAFAWFLFCAHVLRGFLCFKEMIGGGL